MKVRDVYSWYRFSYSLLVLFMDQFVTHRWIWYANLSSYIIRVDETGIANCHVEGERECENERMSKKERERERMWYWVRKRENVCVRDNEKKRERMQEWERESEETHISFDSDNWVNSPLNHCLFWRKNSWMHLSVNLILPRFSKQMI